MREDQDPFKVFEMPAKRNLEPPQAGLDTVKKKVHKDPMAFLENKLFKDEEVGLDSEDQQDDKKLENIEIEVIREDEGCIHEVFFPKDYDRKIFTGEPTAKKYKFKLDPFQRKSINAIESDESVLVCAHTSAGKTAIAEYAIASSLKKHSRVIYTSPIKALSNQKYRELKEEFEDVGLITGDVTIDQGATCLVMTTEILRNMIYRGSQIVREVKWIIFDEVHYMRDKERGVVWEETIIMLPSNVKYVFLSATIGNPSQFACWITKLRKQPCNVVYTDYRPVPLEHYLCPSGGEGLYLVVDDKGKFHDNNFNKAIESLGQSTNIIGLDSKKKKNLSQGSDLSKIIKTVMEKGLDPVIVFSFSKKDVESYARSVCQKYDLTTKAEKERIDEVYTSSLSILDEKDKSLPQIVMMKEIIKKGVGIHHGGLLPLLKEVVELLFQDNLLKVLFSTETFSMGLNMPARTVIFTSVRKFDGEQARWIRGGEYIQMSGRAGRRGIDKKGTTILMIDEKMQPGIAKDMLKGKSDDLLSSFYINYHMLLNSQRLEDIDVEYILARSLLQFQQDAKLPALMQEHKVKMQKYKGLVFEEEADLQSLFLLKEKLIEEKNQLRLLSHTPQRILPFMNIGRIIHLIDGTIDWGFGISINFHKKQIKKNHKNSDKNDTIYLFDCMVYTKLRKNGGVPTPAKLNEEGELLVLTFAINCIFQLATIKISNLPNDLTSQASKKLIHKTLHSLTSKELATLIIDSNEPEALSSKHLIAKTEEQIEALKHLEPRLESYVQKRNIYEELKKSAKNLKELSAIVLKKQKKAFSRVIKRAGLVEKGVVTLKGNVTCEINSNHQILLTDLIFSGYFNDMTAIEIAAILSSLVHQQKSSTERTRTKTPKLRSKLEELIGRAKNIFLIFKECKVAVEEEQYVDTIKEQLIEVTYEWCNGADFGTLCKMTDSYEGSIIRTLRRLNELLKNMSSAAKVIGNQELSAKFEEGGKKVFRGIVFAASLYTL